MFKPRLGRLETVFGHNPIYFVTACTAERRPLLANVGVQGALVSFATRATERKVFIGRYVLMPDHIHLFVAMNQETLTLSAWMKSLKNALSKELRNQGHAAPHWQKGFFDHLLRSTESYAEKWAYVALNPVRAGLVEQARDWAYQGQIHPLELRRD